MIKFSKINFHFLSILIIGSSATIWSVYTINIKIPFLWMLLLMLWIILIAPDEFKMVFRRFAKIGLFLISLSILQLVFRRTGTILFSINEFPIIFSDGVAEAILLWIRLMIIFMLAFIFSQVSIFNFLLFLNKIKISFQLSLLILTTIRFIPFVFDEAKKSLWTLRFRGINLKKLSVRNKFFILKKMFIPLLYRGIHYLSFSSLALELRGYGTLEKVVLNKSYPLLYYDYVLIFFLLIINICCIFSLV